MNRRAYDCAWLIAAAIRKDKSKRCTIGLLLALAATVAYGADFEAYRDALVAGDSAKLAAMTAIDRAKLPIDCDGVTVLRKALHICIVAYTRAGTKASLVGPRGPGLS